MSQTSSRNFSEHEDMSQTFFKRSQTFANRRPGIFANADRAPQTFNNVFHFFTTDDSLSMLSKQFC